MKRLGLVTSVGVIVAAAWAAGSYYANTKIEEELKAFIADSTRHQDWKIQLQSHDRSVLSATGSVLAAPLGLGDLTEDDVPTLQIAYHIQSGLLPGSLARVTWTAAFTGSMAQELQNAGLSLDISGAGAIGYGGQVTSSYTTKDINTQSDGTRLTLSPLYGSVRFDANSWDADATLNKVSIRGKGEAFDVAGLKLAASMTDVASEIGRTTLNVDKISSDNFTLEGLSYLTEIAKIENAYRIHTKADARMVEAEGQTFNNLALDQTLKGVDSQSLLTISQILEDTQWLQNSTADDIRRLKKSLRTALEKGMVLSIDTVSGRMNDGGFDGRFQFELQPSSGKSRSIAIAKQAKFNGDIEIQGQLIPVDARKTLLRDGVVVRTADGHLKASYQFADGSLTANGESVDAGMVHLFLMEMETQINRALAE